MAATPPYSPKPGPVQEDPQITEIVQWAQREMEAISKQFTNFNILQQNVSYVEPDRPRDGMLAVADGTAWNPGGGGGQYVYRNGGWVLNSTGPIPPFPSLTTYMTKAANLSDVANVASAKSNLGLATVASTGAYSSLSGLPTLGTAAGYNVNVYNGLPVIYDYQGDGGYYYPGYSGRFITEIAHITWPYPGVGTAITAAPNPGVGTVGWGVAVAGVNLGWLGFSTSVTGTSGCGFITGISSNVTWNQWSNLGGTWYNLTGQAVGGCFAQGYGTFVRLA